MITNNELIGLCCCLTYIVKCKPLKLYLPFLIKFFFINKASRHDIHHGIQIVLIAKTQMLNLLACSTLAFTYTLHV